MTFYQSIHVVWSPANRKACATFQLAPRDKSESDMKLTRMFLECGKKLKERPASMRRMFKCDTGGPELRIETGIF